MNDRCPVTGAAATRMTRAGFARTCAAKRRERQGCDWVFTRCETCKGRPENWPPELEIIEMEATMTAKKPTKSKETELLAKLQLEVAEKEKLIERLAAMLGCLPGDIEQAMATMQGLVQEIRDIVEPEVADAQPENLPEACRELAKRRHAAKRDNDGLQEIIRQLRAKLNDAEVRIDRLYAEGRKVWDALDGDVEECTLLELAEKRWREIETLRGNLLTAHNTIKRLERDIEALADAAAVPPPVQDDGEAAGILRDLMRKLVDGRISLIHNHA